MARIKFATRRVMPLKAHIGLNDMMPCLLIDDLCSLPSSDAHANDHGTSSSHEPPSKRRKTFLPPNVPSIPIAKAQIEIHRLCATVAPKDYVETRYDVQQDLNLGVRDNSVYIHTWSSSPLSISTWVSFNPQDMSKHGDAVFNAAGPDSKNDLPGAMWKRVKLTIERNGRHVVLKLSAELYWNETLSPYSRFRSSDDRSRSQEILDTWFASSDATDLSRQQSRQQFREQSTWSPMEFYDAAHVPSKEDEEPLSIETSGLESSLFPYQKRTVQWLLRREGVRWSDASKGIESRTTSDDDQDVNTFRKLTDISGNEFYLSHLFHAVTRDVTPFRETQASIKGGILCEEMGLGKTLEILALIILHPRPSPPVLTKFETEAGLVPTGATLIVTPESLRAQWIDEIARHAPGLNVKFYQGRKRVSGHDEDEIVNELIGYDVVITTYSILSAELHFALVPPERSRRHERAYPRPKSPLVQLSWWRVCLDEAQMIENGFSQAATVARVIPRINAWGITGTPVKDTVNDLFGLLLFLRYEPYCSVTPVWLALIRSHKPLFRQLFNSIALRHTKTMVRDELLLPTQRRFVISMPFTAVEEQHYQSLYQEMTEVCRLSCDGVPTVNDWELNNHEEDMRTWLNRLRQTALHPEIAVYNRRTLGQNNKARPMRTVEEVLDAMLEQSVNTIRADERAYLTSKLTRGQLYENTPHVQESLEIWKAVREEARKLVAEARAEHQTLLGKGNANGAVSRMKNSRDGSEESEEEADDIENQGLLGESRRRLRGALEMEHKAVFFCANAYFQIREQPELTQPDSEEFHRLKILEDDGYEEAKVIRREILRGAHGKAMRLMNKIAQNASNQSFTELPELVASSESGIESNRIVKELEALYGEMNEQANVIDEWREYIIRLLLEPLVDEEGEDETTGEELGESARIQDELMVYVQVLRAAIADRQEALTGLTNELITYETKTSLRFAQEGEGPAPGKLIELTQMRLEMQPKTTTMRKAISEFRSLASRLARDSNRSIMESEIADMQLKATQKFLIQQTKAAASLESEVESFKTTMNLRLEYYRQLQSVSDSVLPYEGLNTEAAIEKFKETEENLRKKLSSAEAKHRYLLNLKEAGSKSNEPRMCVICQTSFTVGVLTVCGHQFCKECMMLWFKAHHNCPVCKKQLKSSSLHDITINPQQLKVHADNPSDGQLETTEHLQERRSSLAKHSTIYSEFNSGKLAEIQNVELDGPSFTTKVDTLVKHLIWLRESDPGAKSIVFSQYKGFLNILRNAFTRFRIGFSSIDDPRGITRFKEDASIECFLLHARAHSSGLNLVNASHVFLCEPLLNTALELQAIARVDRIGQQHETTVWLYLVSGTVEESIYNLSVQRRMEHMNRNTKGKTRESTPELLDANIEAANTLELEQAALSRLMSKDKTAGENVDKTDLWECLFGHVARKGDAPERDTRLQEQAVMGYLAAEAAEERMKE